jgi:hypothetical protein
MQQLHVVTAIANPVRWTSRIRLYRDFVSHMLDSGVALTTVECAFGDRPHELDDNPHVNHVAVRASGGSLAWSKETLLNIGVARLPPAATLIATLDADIRFRQAGWAVETVHALQHYQVVQPWSDCYDLGPAGEHLEIHRSFCRLVYEQKPILQGPSAVNAPYQFGHPGYAWAWRRSVLDGVGGLIETAALGAADHHQAMAMIGRVEDSIPGNLPANYTLPLKVWQSRILHTVQRNISYVPGTIEHYFHGAKNKRSYIDRWGILVRHRFDPYVDLLRNSYGVTELAGNKPGLRHDVDRYFRLRSEDATTLE